MVRRKWDERMQNWDFPLRCPNPADTIHEKLLDGPFGKAILEHWLEETNQAKRSPAYRRIKAHEDAGCIRHVSDTDKRLVNWDYSKVTEPIRMIISRFPYTIDPAGFFTPRDPATYSYEHTALIDSISQNLPGITRQEIEGSFNNALRQWRAGLERDLPWVREWDIKLSRLSEDETARMRFGESLDRSYERSFPLGRLRELLPK